MFSRSFPVSVFVIDLLRGYGSERYTVQLVNALASTGIPVDLLCQIRGSTLIQEVHPRVRQIEIGTTNPLTTVWFLYKYFKTHRPRVFFPMMEKPSLLGIVAGFFAGYRNIVPTLHFDIDAYASLEHGARRKFLRLLIALFYRYAPVIVAVSSGVGQSLQRWVGMKKKIVTILNGFDLSYLRTRAKEKPEHPWFTDKTVPVVIGCGRLVPLKGFDTLIKAFALVRGQMPARLVILGEGPLRSELQAMIEVLGLQDDALLAGYAANPQAWLANSDVFVLSSRSEGFGNVVVEALASGAQVVSTNCPSGPPEILEQGRWGTLVPVGDAPAMAQAIVQALTRPRDSAEDAALQASLDERFSLDAMTRGYMALVERLSP